MTLKSIPTPAEAATPTAVAGPPSPVLSARSSSLPQQQWEGNAYEQQPSQPQPQPQLNRSSSSLAEKFSRLSSAAGGPLNRAANFVGAESVWPTSMDKECNKAARILHSFTHTGIPAPVTDDTPRKHPSRKALVKIPTPALQSCAGLAIFNVLRAGGCHGSLAGGSGVVLARLPDGSWSPPSAFVVSTLGAGFSFGIDIYECVCVLHTPEQVAAFTKPRFSLGGEAAVAVGPVGTGASLDAALSNPRKPVWSYMKSRGLWAGVQVDGTVMLSRPGANTGFYGAQLRGRPTDEENQATALKSQSVAVERILAGEFAWPAGGKHLFDVLRGIEALRNGVTEETVSKELGSEKSQGDAGEEVEHTHGYQEVLESDDDDDVAAEKRRLAKSGY